MQCILYMNIYSALIYLFCCRVAIVDIWCKGGLQDTLSGASAEVATNPGSSEAVATALPPPAAGAQPPTAESVATACWAQLCHIKDEGVLPQFAVDVVRNSCHEKFSDYCCNGGSGPQETLYVYIYIYKYIYIYIYICMLFEV